MNDTNSAGSRVAELMDKLYQEVAAGHGQTKYSVAEQRLSSGFNATTPDSEQADIMANALALLELTDQVVQLQVEHPIRNEAYVGLSIVIGEVKRLLGIINSRL